MKKNPNPKKNKIKNKKGLFVHYPLCSTIIFPKKNKLLKRPRASLYPTCTTTWVLFTSQTSYLSHYYHLYQTQINNHIFPK